MKRLNRCAAELGVAAVARRVLPALLSVLFLVACEAEPAASPRDGSPTPTVRHSDPRAAASPAGDSGRLVPAAAATAPVPDREGRREPPATSMVGGDPCNPSSIGGTDLWYWENTMRWTADGAAVFFSQGPLVYAAAADGAWARLVAVASGRLGALIDQASFARWARHEIVGPMTYFDVSPEGDRLVYATCVYREEAVTAVEQATAAALHRFLRGQGSSRDPLIYNFELAAVGLGAEAPVERLTTNMGFDNFPAWSPDGTRIAYLHGDNVRAGRLVTMNADGSDRRSIETDEHWFGLYPPQWSPDGRRLALLRTLDGWEGRFTASAQHLAIYVVGADGTDLRWVGHTNSGPSWSPDGRRLAFVSTAGDQSDAWDLVTVEANGTHARRLALPPGWEPRYSGGHYVLDALWSSTDSRDWWIPTLAWSPAGDQVLYTCGRHICVVDLNGTPVGRSPIAWTSGSVAAWSPDGTRIALAAAARWHEHEALEVWRASYPFVDNDSAALYTMAPDGTDVRVLARHNGGNNVHAVWPRPAVEAVGVTGCAAGVAVPEPAANPGLVRDCETLLRVLTAWDHELNWSAYRPIREWVGVTLGGSPRRVRALVLSRRSRPAAPWMSQGLEGAIPPELGDLDQLEILDLTGHALGGTIPPELGRLTQLVSLDLGANSLSGQIPKALGDLSTLASLSLAGNFLMGGIPPELGQLPNLTSLRLAENRLTGPIPKELKQLTSLRTLELNDNALTGRFPPLLSELPLLNQLLLGGNQLSGCIPADLGPTRVHDLRDLGLPRCAAGA